jgi:hypothetical protein
LPEAYFWPGCRNRPRPNDYRQTRSLLGYSAGDAGFDHVAAPLPAAWTVDEATESICIRDANGQALDYYEADRWMAWRTPDDRIYH